MPASTSGKKSSPGWAVGSLRGAETGRRPGEPQPRAAKRTTALWLFTSRIAALSLSSGGSSPAQQCRHFSGSLKYSWIAVWYNMLSALLFQVLPAMIVQNKVDAWQTK